MKRNPKQEGSNLFDCRPQVGPCPNNCNQCFYNRPNAFYNDINQPSIPSPEEVGDGIVRMNCGHDSNIERDLVIETAKQYKHFFFNTSIPKLDFPGPVVLTANPKEEEHVITPQWLSCNGQDLSNIMFVRLRVSSTNLDKVYHAVERWITWYRIPVVLTFMAYYDEAPPGTFEINDPDYPMSYKLEDDSEFPYVAYTWQKRHINSYYCATEEFMQYVTKKMKQTGGRLVTRCGTSKSRFCKDCRNCETYYYQTMKHLSEN